MVEQPMDDPNGSADRDAEPPSTLDAAAEPQPDGGDQLDHRVADDRVTDDRVTDDRVTRARELAAQGNVLAAIAALREVVTEQPRDLALRRELARMLEQNGQGDAAVLELDRALEHSPDDVALLCARAALLIT
ncbi:MAG TPA: tetratricopeptide repeat protein, partial [Gemmatimonadaceae bacterium]|nr:tetratricopeptide repeat protein [Gemmatimonadaceae bacterium]